jgi:hypothetical protein
MSFIPPLDISIKVVSLPPPPLLKYRSCYGLDAARRCPVFIDARIRVKLGRSSSTVEYSIVLFSLFPCGDGDLDSFLQEYRQEVLG